MERHHSDGETFFNKFGQRERTGIGLRQRVPPPGIVTSTSFDHQSFPQPQHDSFRNIAALTSDERLLLKGLRPAGHGAPPPSLHSPPLGLHGHHHSHHHYQLPYSNEQQQQQHQYGGTTLSSYATFSTSEVLRQQSPPKSHRQSAVHFTSGEEGGDDLFQEIDRLRSSAYDMTRTNIYGTPHGDSLARQEELRRRPSWDMQPLDEVHHQPASQKGKMSGSTPLVQLMPSSKVVSPPPTMGGAVVSSSHPHPNPHTASPQQGTGYGTSWTSFNGPSGGVSSSSSLPHSSLSRHPLHEASPQLNKQQHRPPKQLDPLSSPPSVTTGGGAGGPCSSSGPSSVLLSPPRYSGIGGGHHHQHHPLLTTGGGEENIAALLQQTSTNNDASPTRHRSLSPVEKQMRHVANLPGGMYCQPVPSCIEPLLQQQQQQQRAAKVTGKNAKSTERRGRR